MISHQKPSSLIAPKIRYNLFLFKRHDDKLRLASEGRRRQKKEEIKTIKCDQFLALYCFNHPEREK